jgi:hypothetical protein
MSYMQGMDTGESYVALDLFQPPTAHREAFSTALDRVVVKIGDLIPQFGLRNPRIGETGTYRYQFCGADEWVSSSGRASPGWPIH